MGERQGGHPAVAALGICRLAIEIRDIIAQPDRGPHTGSLRSMRHHQLRQNGPHPLDSRRQHYRSRNPSMAKQLNPPYQPALHQVIADCRD